MKKLLLFAVAAMLGTADAYGQEDVKAKQILGEVSKAFRTYKSVSGSFDYIMHNEEEGIHEVNSGDFVLKGQKYKITLSPIGVEMYCDGNDVRTFMIDANEVTIADMNDEANEIMNPSRLFTIYEDGFSNKYVGESVVNGHPVHVADLIPEGRSSDYTRIRLEVDKQLKLIRKAELSGRDGNSYTILMKELKTDVAVDDGLFVFDNAKHPGVEIVDLRE